MNSKIHYLARLLALLTALMALPAVAFSAKTLFLESGGQVVVEAENFSSRTPDATGKSWLVVPDENPGAGPRIANARSGKYIQSLPDNSTGGATPQLPPSIEYKMQINTPGTYRLFVRWDGNSTNINTQGMSDSLFVDIVELKDGPGGGIADWYELVNSIEGNFAVLPWDGGGGAEQNIVISSDNPMDWVVNKPGIYTLRFSQREDGAAVDAFVLQLATLPAPTGNGPPESALSSGAFEILPKAGGDTGAVTVQFFRLDEFVEGTSVKLVKDGEPPIAGTSIYIGETGTSLKSTFALTGKSQGLWNVVVTNPDGTSQTLDEGFTIEKGLSPEPWVDLLGLNLIRFDRVQQNWLTFGNKGNVDLYGAHLFLKVPANIEYKLGDDKEFRVFPDDVVAHIYISHLPAQAVISMPLSVRVTAGQRPFNIEVAISDNPEGFRIVHSSRYQIDAVIGTENSVISPSLSINQPAQQFKEYLPGACPTNPNALVAPSALTPTGYVDYFLVDVKGGASYIETALRIGSDVTWSFPCGSGLDKPNCGVTKVPYANFGFNEKGVGTHPDSDIITIKHLFSVRPGTQADWEKITWLETEYLKWQGKPFCIGQPHNVCPSCIGYVVGMLYPNGSMPKDIPYDKFTELDALSFWLTANKCDVVSIFEEKGPTDFPQEWLDWWKNNKESFNKTPVGSFDPNVKLGLLGWNSAQYISGVKPLVYSIAFENAETATAPAQEVVIHDQLKVKDLDLTTFSFGPISFGDVIVNPPMGAKTFVTGADLRPGKNLIVKVDASLNPDTGLLTWGFKSIDPATGQLPTDPLAGFLPPNKNPPEGDGGVVYTVMPKAGLPTGTEIRNKATIVFDTNDPIETPEWLNTLDVDKPASNVLPLPATVFSSQFPVSWSGSDLGAGIKDYTVYVSENNGPFMAWLNNIPDTTATFTGGAGKTYGFYSVARDLVGNVEDADAVADTQTLVPLAPPTLSALITGKTGAQNARVWTVTLSNSGPGSAVTAQLNGLILTQSAGTACTPLITSALPLVVGDISPKSSASGQLTLDFSGCAAAARFTATITYSSNGGTVNGSKILYNQFR